MSPAASGFDFVASLGPLATFPFQKKSAIARLKRAAFSVDTKQFSSHCSSVISPCRAWNNDCACNAAWLVLPPPCGRTYKPRWTESVMSHIHFGYRSSYQTECITDQKHLAIPKDGLLSLEVIDCRHKRLFNRFHQVDEVRVNY